MATISIYAGKTGRMPGLMKDAQKAVSSLKDEMAALKRRCERVNASVCNIGDIISTISASTRTQEDKIEVLEAFGERVEEFAEETAETDERVAEIVNGKKRISTTHIPI